MTENKLTSTHKRLTLLFTGVMFAVVMILGGSFLVAKYAGQSQFQKRDFIRQVKDVEKRIRNQDSLAEIFPRFREFDNLQRFDTARKERRDERKTISFFVIEDNTIVFQSISEEPHFDIPRRDFYGIYKDDNTYVSISKIDTKRVVAYKEIDYSFDEFFRDVLGLLFLSLIFSGFFYFIGYRFVGRALKPVEENLSDMQAFIHNAGHELKTPLAVMGGNLQIMKAEKAFDEKLVKSSLRSIDTMNSLIEGLRELSELGSLSEKQNLALVVEIKKLCKEYSSMLQSKNITFHDSTSGAFTVFANKNELHVLLANILSNAIKYTPEGGDIYMSLKKNVLSIRDTGKGMTQEEQEKMFDRFYQGSQARSGEGFGIGLSLVKKIADANGWKLQVRSEVGKGTNFEVIF